MMVAKAVPRVLYKFIPLSGVGFLVDDETIRFTPPTELNDPFEFFAAAPERFRRMGSFRDNAMRERGLALESLSSRSRAQLICGERLVLWCSERQPPNRRIGILSLTKSCRNLLLWAHYASSHAGLAVGILSSHSLIADAQIDGISGPQPVRYTTHRPDELVFDGKNWPKGESANFLVKSRRWRYEQEFRCFRYLKDIPPINDKGPGIMPFPRTAIASVTLGMGMIFRKNGLTFAESIIKWAEKIPAISVNVAVPAVENFKVDILPAPTLAVLKMLASD